MHGNIDKYNLSRANLDFELKNQGLELNEVIYGAVDENNKYILYRKNN